MKTISEGSTLGDRYMLVALLASGGMGDVWRATDHRLEREVAVKVLRGEFGHDEVTRQRFRFEAQAAASLTSSGVATVFDYGEEPSAEGSHRAYIVMELVRGESLEARARREGPLGVEPTLDIIEQTAVALQAAHERGLVHRDIKPANLLLRTDGVVKVTDFGIARALDGSTLTQQGTMVGTVRYMSPEQLSGLPATPASDLYALGIVAYFCLVGHTPFDRQESMAVALAHVQDPPPPMPPRVPAPVAEFVAQLLAKEPSERPASAGVVASMAANLKIATGPSPPPWLRLGRADPASGQRPSGTAPSSPVSSEPSDLTVTDRRPTGVMVLPPIAVGDPRERPRRHLGRLVLSVLVAALAAALVLWLLAGPDRVTVPHVQGLTARAAETSVNDLGLHADERLVDTNQGAGRVIAQRPRGGASVTGGTRVVLDISSGFEAIDTGLLQGLPAAQASAQLTSLGMRPDPTPVISGATPGTVVSISPSGRQRLGTTVVMGVAVAPPPPPPTTTTTSTPPPSHKKASRSSAH